MRYVVAFILISFSFIGCSDKEELLSPTGMKEDIQYYFRFIREIHPNPYLRYDSMTFVRLEDEIIVSCSEPMTKRNFGFKLMKTRKFLDGHVGVSDFFPPPGRYRLPSIEFKRDLMLLGNDTLLAIGDSETFYTAQDIDSMISWDQPSRIRNENMNMLLNKLLSPANEPGKTYTGVLKTGNGICNTVICVDTCTEKKSPVYTLPYSSNFYPKDSIAVLYYNTCMIYEKEDLRRYGEFVDSFFCDLKNKGIKTLFIDISRNGGGSDGNNSAILNHLKTDKYTFKFRMSGKRAGVEKYLKSDLIKKYFEENKANGDSWIKNWGNPIMEKGEAVQEGSVPGRKSGFEGDVFVIMGNRTFSAGASFCLAIKLSKAALLVGEKAGQYYPICGNVIRDTLPNSKIIYQVPSTETVYDPPTLFQDGYICPDILYALKENLDLDDYKQIIEMKKLISDR